MPFAWCVSSGKLCDGFDNKVTSRRLDIVQPPRGDRLVAPFASIGKDTKRRDFLTFGASAVAFSAVPFLSGIRLAAQAASSRLEEGARFSNWADPALGAQASASSQHSDPPWGYAPEPDFQSFLELSPGNLIMTAMKKSEDDDRIVIRFYEAEGNPSLAQVRLATPISHAWKADLIEEDETALEPHAEGSLSFPAGAWEIVTLKVAA